MRSYDTGREDGALLVVHEIRANLLVNELVQDISADVFGEIRQGPDKRGDENH